MRTAKHLFSQLCDPHTLQAAALSSARGKRRRADVAWHLFRLESETDYLATELRHGRWRHGHFARVCIWDPKPRVIAKASFADRVVQLAVARLLEPTIVRSRVDGVFGCLPGLGTHRAVLRLHELQGRHRFMLHLDVRAYFPTIDPQRVRALLEQRVRDRQMLGVVERILEAGRGFYDAPWVRAFSRLEPDWPLPGRGLPIGASTSQLFASHLYLCALDHLIKRQLKIPGYVRYVDDMFLFANSRLALRQARSAIGDWLGSERELRLKHPHARVLRCAGTLHALGHTLRRESLEALPRARARFVRRARAHWGDRDGGLAGFRRSAASSVGVQMFGLHQVRKAEENSRESDPDPNRRVLFAPSGLTGAIWPGAAPS